MDIKILLLRTYLAGMAFFFGSMAFAGDLPEVIISLLIVHLVIRLPAENMIKHGNKLKGIFKMMAESESFLKSVILMGRVILFILIEAIIIVLLINFIHRLLYNYIIQWPMEPYLFGLLYGLITALQMKLQNLIGMK